MRALPGLLVALPFLASAAPASPAGGATPSPETLARGERVMRRFCLSCHGSPGGAVEDPLGPRLRPETWTDEARAYALVGQLTLVNRRMDQPFSGSDEDRRALAAWLAHRAGENRASLARRAGPWLALIAAAGSAGAVLLGARRRGGRAGRPG